MNVLHVTSHYAPQTGGVITVVREVAENLARRGHEQHVLALGHGRLPEGDEVLRGVHVHRRQSATSHRLMGYAPELGRAWRALRPVWEKADVVQVHSFHALLGPQALRLVRASGKPVVFSPHYHGRGHYPLTRALFPLYERLARGSFAHADLVVCVSRHEAALLRERLRPKAPIEVVPNGVAFPILPRALPPREGPRRFLSVGFLERYKRVDLALEGLALARAEGLEATLDVVGTGPEEARLRALAAKLGLDGVVSWRRQVPFEDLARLYAESDALVFLSEAEAFGLVAAEALACGTPVLLRDGNAIAEFAAVPGAIMLGEPVTARAVADAMRAPLPEVRVPQGSDKVVPWSEVARRYEELYARVAKGARR